MSSGTSAGTDTGDAVQRPGRIDYTTTLDSRTKAFILAGVLLGLFLAALDQTIVATALPRIVSELQGIELLAWTSTAYLLASTAMIPIYGKLSDIYGRKIILLTGIGVFLLGSALCGIAPSMLMLVVFRGVQGLGAAALTSTAFAVPADLFPPSERARYQGIFGGVFGLASVVGPYFGGLLTDSVGWRWVFYVNVPIGILATGFILARMPKLDSGVKSRIDYLGAATLLVAVIPLLLGLTLDHAQHPWGSPLILGMFALSALGTGLFLFVESRTAAPILPLGLFRNRTFALIIPASALVGACLLLTVMFLSIYLVNVLGVSATTAGTTLIPLTLSILVGSIGSSLVVQRLGKWKAPVIVGLLLIAAGFAWLSTMDTHTTLNGVRLRMILVGLGLGPSLPVLNLVLQNAVPYEAVGAATASRQFFQQLGQAVGVAIFGVMLTTTLSNSMEKNLAPLRASLPPEVAAQLDISKMRNGSGGESTGVRVALSDKIAQGIHQSFAAQRAVLMKAVKDNDPAAIQQVLANPRAPDKVKNLLRAGGVRAVVEKQIAQREQQVARAIREGRLEELQQDASVPAQLREALAQIPAPAVTTAEGKEAVIAQVTSEMEAHKADVTQQVSAQIESALDKGLADAETAAVAGGVDTGRRIEEALKLSFTAAVTELYRYGVPLVLLALLVMWFVPQTPLRRSNAPVEPAVG